MNRVTLQIIQTALHTIYPPQCLGCGAPVESDFGLCGSCWRGVHFLDGMVCDKCGAALHEGDENHALLCDDCLKTARPWKRGRAVFAYKETGRELVIGLKYHDRQDLVRPAAKWMAKVAQSMVKPDTLVLAVPLHWRRLLSRRYNQAGLLAVELARELGLQAAPDALVRHNYTEKLDGMDRAARFSCMNDAKIRAHPKRGRVISGRSVLLVDDVMTSGATLSAACQACFQAGADDVFVQTLARAMKEV